MRDLIAEYSVLGAVMVSPKIAGPALLMLAADEFTPGKEQALAGLLTDMIRRGEHLDPIIVHTEAVSRGVRPSELTASWLLELTSHCYDPRSAEAYAGQVREVYRHNVAKAAAGGVSDAMTRADESGELGYTDELILRGRAAFDQIPEPLNRLTTEPPRTLEDLLSVEPTFDWLVPNLLERGERLMLTGQEGLGKRLRVDEPIPTPSGWTTMGLIVPGDQVFGADGKPCTVTAVSPVEPFPDAWAVEFDDGSVVEADAQHQWVTVDYRARQRDHERAVHTTEQIRLTLRARSGHTVNHAVPVAAPLEMPEAVLPVPPYMLGVWAGDGTTSTASLTLNREDAPSICEGLAAEGVAFHTVPSQQRPGSVGVRIEDGSAMLRAAGLLGNKSIPDAYLRSSIEQRTALLAGLMDTDGSIVESAGTGRGQGAATCEITLTCKVLIQGVLELIRSLGIKAKVAESDAVLDGRIIGRRWRIHFQSPFNPFRTPRKAARWIPLRTLRTQYRYIVAVRRVEPTPMRCISVDSIDHTYLAGRRMIPTHNSHLLRQVAACLAGGVHPFTGERFGDGLRVLHVDAENGVGQTRRAYANIAGRLAHYRPGHGWRRNLMIENRPEGLDLPGDDRAWWDRICAATAPDVIITGPIYRLALGNPNSEEDARKLVHAVDAPRVRHHAALILEAHAGHGSNQPGAKRAMRPAGASMWMRWPENGLAIRRADDDPGGRRAMHVTVDEWRMAREARAWPDALEHGLSNRLPWVPVGPYDGWAPEVPA